MYIIVIQGIYPYYRSLTVTSSAVAWLASDASSYRIYYKINPWVQITFKMADFQPLYFQSHYWLLASFYGTYTYMYTHRLGDCSGSPAAWRSCVLSVHWFSLAKSLQVAECSSSEQTCTPWLQRFNVVPLLLRRGRAVEVLRSVCLSVCVCLPAIISLESLDRSSRIFLCRSPVAVVRYSSGGVAIRYVLPVLWMMPRWAAVGRMAKHGRLYLQPTTTSACHQVI